MEHKLIPEFQILENCTNFISVMELKDNTCTISITKQPYSSELEELVLCSNLTKKELHSFIGTLLHVQQKMKGSV